MKTMKKILISMAVFLSVTGTASAQWAVIDPSNLIQNILSAVEGAKTATNMVSNFKETVKIFEQGKEYYDALKKIKNLVKDAKKVQETILMIGDISEIYVTSFNKMLSDPYFEAVELEGIAYGYAVLLEQASLVLADLKTIINENGLSMNDKERMEIIDKCYDKVYEYRGLVQYYTNKNIGVSYLRAKQKNEQDRVLALYGSPSERYW